ncbi:MAG TPA: hypothetical protein VGF84_04925 [Micromonosporaceae bacterium]
MSSTVPGWSPGQNPAFSARPGVPRPIYREPAPARSGSVLLGAGAGALWMMLFGLLGHSARSYVWWSIGAGMAGWIASYVLARLGDRGVAAGVAIATGFGVAVAVSVVMVNAWHGHWVAW